jgi:hypothetical protein
MGTNQKGNASSSSSSDVVSYILCMTTNTLQEQHTLGRHKRHDHLARRVGAVAQQEGTWSVGLQTHALARQKAGDVPLTKLSKSSEAFVHKTHLFPHVDVVAAELQTEQKGRHERAEGLCAAARDSARAIEELTWTLSIDNLEATYALLVNTNHWIHNHNNPSSNDNLVANKVPVGRRQRCNRLVRSRFREKLITASEVSSIQEATTTTQHT